MQSDGKVFVALLVALLAVSGAWRSWQLSETMARSMSDPYGVEAAAARLSGVAAEIPAGTEMLYFSDMEGTDRGVAAFLAAQYAVAPNFLVREGTSAKPRFALGNFSQPLDYRAEGERRGFQLKRELGNGIVIYERK